MFKIETDSAGYKYLRSIKYDTILRSGDLVSLLGLKDTDKEYLQGQIHNLEYYGYSSVQDKFKFRAYNNNSIKLTPKEVLRIIKINKGIVLNKANLIKNNTKSSCIIELLSEEVLTENFGYNPAEVHGLPYYGIERFRRLIEGTAWFPFFRNQYHDEDILRRNHDCGFPGELIKEEYQGDFVYIHRDSKHLHIGNTEKVATGLIHKILQINPSISKFETIRDYVVTFVGCSYKSTLTGNVFKVHRIDENEVVLVNGELKLKVPKGTFISEFIYEEGDLMEEESLMEEGLPINVVPKGTIVLTRNPAVRIRKLAYHKKIEDVACVFETSKLYSLTTRGASSGRLNTRIFSINESGEVRNFFRRDIISADEIIDGIIQELDINKPLIVKAVGTHYKHLVFKTAITAAGHLEYVDNTLEFLAPHDKQRASSNDFYWDEGFKFQEGAKVRDSSNGGALTIKEVKGAPIHFEVGGNKISIDKLIEEFTPVDIKNTSVVTSVERFNRINSNKKYYEENKEVLMVWKNSKRKKANLELSKDCLCVVDGLEIPQRFEKMTSNRKDAKVLLHGDSKRYDKSEVFRLFELKSDAVPQIGDVAFCLGGWLVITGLESLSYVKDNREVSTLFRYTPPEANDVLKRRVSRYACGTLKCLDSGNIIQELDSTTVSEITDTNYSMEHFKISEHYNVDPEKLQAKDEAILSKLKVSLDHPINMAASEWALLVGPSGSGKTSVAMQYAKDKGLSYVVEQGSAQLTRDDLIGYKSITTGEYFRSLLRDAVEYGKVFILDEIDGCNPNTLLVLNSLKSEYFQFPDELVKVHENFRFIATANTLEYSEEYNSRAPMDKATIKRFDIIEYDMEPQELAIRYGLDYIVKVQDLGDKDPRQVEREVNKLKIKAESKE